MRKTSLSTMFDLQQTILLSEKRLKVFNANCLHCRKTSVSPFSSSKPEDTQMLILPGVEHQIVLLGVMKV